jgi:hypothetical protein
VRRMLLTQRAIVDGGRVLVYLTGQVADVAAARNDEEGQGAKDLLDFLTPIVKGMLTELGFESVNHGLQIFGGHGFIRENGMEQRVRDTRITLLYEGTTGIQALDLLGRKILQTQGPGLKRFIGMMNELAADLAGSEDAFLSGVAPVLEARGAEWDGLANALMGKAMENLDEVGAASVDFLFYSGYLTLAYCWGRIALTARRGLDGAAEDEARYLAGKLAAARFYFARILPRAVAHRAAIDSGADTLMKVEAAALGPW